MEVNGKPSLEGKKKSEKENNEKDTYIKNTKKETNQTRKAKEKQ